MRRADAVRLVAGLGAIEMALVRQDPVSGPLLAQTARAAAGTGVAEWLATASAIARQPGIIGDDPEARARRKVVQALCRAAAQVVQAALLEDGIAA